MKNPFNAGKPTVLICVLCDMHNHWVNPFLANDLLKMSHDTRYAVQIEFMVGKSPVDYARNCCIAMARERKVSHLVMLDSDQSFSPAPIPNPLDVLSKGPEKDVIAFAYMQGFDFTGGVNGRIPRSYSNRQPLSQDGEFLTAPELLAGTGAMIISHNIWDTIRGPWFVWTYAPGELHETQMGEDFGFCRLVQQHGFKVWLYGGMCPHWKTADVTVVGTLLDHAAK